MERSTLLEYEYIYIPGAVQSKRTFLILHGTGGDEFDLIDIAHSLDPEAHIVSPRGNVQENGHNRFFERFGEGVFNEEDIIVRSKDLGDFIKAVQEKYSLEQTKLIAVGYSNGANIAAAMLLLCPLVFEGAVLFRAMLPIASSNEQDLSGQHVLLLNGLQDQMIGKESASALAELLKKNNAEVTHTWLDAGHQLTQNDVQLAKAWITSYF